MISALARLRWEDDGASIIAYAGNEPVLLVSKPTNFGDLKSVDQDGDSIRAHSVGGTTWTFGFEFTEN